MQKIYSIWTNQKAIVALLLISTLCAFLPSLSNGSVNYDDQAFVFQNNMVTQFSWTKLSELFTSSAGGNYIPLTNLSLAINFYFSGEEPFSYHLVNLLLHLLNTFFVFRFIHLLSNKLKVAALTAFFFGVHPMHVESVAWITERKDVLVACFYLFSMIGYLRYRKQSNLKHQLVFILSGVAAMLAKPSAVTLPLALLLIDFYLDGRLDLKKVLRQTPLFLLAIGVGIATISIQAEEAIGDFNEFTLIQKLGFASYGLAFYLVKAVYPIQLSVMHPYPTQESAWLIKIVLTVVLTLFFIIITVWKAKKHRFLIFGSAFFVLNLLLVLQFFSVGRAIVAERYTYLPYIGLFYIIASVWDHVTATKPNYKIVSRVLSGALVLLAFYSIGATFKRNAVWKSSETLWTNVIEQYPEDWYAYIGRGNHHRDEGDLQAALIDYSKAIALQPDRFKNYFNRGDLYKSMNRTALALKDYNTAISLNPTYAEAYINRGQFFAELGKAKEAINDLNTAIDLNPKYAAAFCNRGNVLLANNQIEAALKDYNRALAIDSSFHKAWYNRGNLWLSQKKFNAAIKDFEVATQLAPNELNAYNNIGNAYFQLGQLYDSQKAFTVLINKFPNYSDGWFNRSVVYYQLGQTKAALRDAIQAKQLGKQVDDSYLEQLR